jgi:O-acetyl-ADP-ribose deacetylase (regulator of RNase III)
VVDLSDEITVASMVAQENFGDDATLSYRALTTCLAKVRDAAVRRSASVHLPRIGTGQGQATWELIEELLQRTLSDGDIEVVVYTRPGDRVTSGRRP